MDMADCVMPVVLVGIGLFFTILSVYFKLSLLQDKVEELARKLGKREADSRA